METSEARFARTHNGKVKRLPKKEKGGSLKEIPANNTGLPKLPEFVRNRMGYMQLGGLNKYMSAMGSQQGGSGDYQLYGDFPYASAKFTFDEGNVEPQPNPTVNFMMVLLWNRLKNIYMKQEYYLD